MGDCICGNDSIYQIGTVIHYPLGKEIKLHNVPHNICNQCDSTWYDIKKVKVSKYIKYAYENKLDEIDYRTILEDEHK